MSEIILQMGISLDGKIEGPNGEIDWMPTDIEDVMTDFLAQVSTIFYGRKSYEVQQNLIPGPNDPQEMHDIFQAIASKQTFVFSNSTADFGSGTQTISGNEADVLTQIAKIKEQANGNIWLFGGEKLVRFFMQHDLIDVYQLGVIPIILGPGMGLFDNLTSQFKLELEHSKVLRHGVLDLKYRRVR